MGKRNSYLEFVRERLAPLGEITARPMMGGYTLYCDGVVFAIIAREVLHLKADDGNRAEFERVGSRPFQPFPDRPGTMGYYPPPAGFFEDDEEMRRWASGAIAAGRRAAEKRRPQAATKKRRRR